MVDLAGVTAIGNKGGLAGVTAIENKGPLSKVTAHKK